MGGFFTGTDAGWCCKRFATARITRDRRVRRRSLLALVRVLLLSIPLAVIPNIAVAASDSLVAQSNLSASQAAAIVRGEHGGRVLSVVPSFRGDERGYRVRVLVGGDRVKTVFVGDTRTRNPSPRNSASRGKKPRKN